MTAMTAVLTPPLRTALPTLHDAPPFTPGVLFRRQPWLLFACLAVLAFLASGALMHHGALLLTWDEPIQRFVEGQRGDELNTLFLTVSRLASTMVVFLIGPLLAALTWRRCHAVSIAIIAATLSRPLVESVAKLLVNRNRPDFDRMVNGTGYSFPSGHVMAAVALWGLLPVVVGLFTKSRAVWWASVVVAGSLIVLIAASRVYLGVHWVSDVVAGILVGSLFLVGVEWVLRLGHGHGRTRCSAC
jgi:undecaprenyl-diphosphatase